MKIHQVIAMAAMTAIGVSFSSCGNTDRYPDMMARTINIEAQGIQDNTLTLEVGQTAQLKATIQPLFTEEGPIAWVSSDDQVATVDENGVVTAVAPGEADICATEIRKGNFGIGEIKVIVKTSDIIPVEGGESEEPGEADQSQAD